MICPECNSRRFYQVDAEEVMYVLLSTTRIESIKKLAGNDYKPEFHDEMVRQLVRCEIMMIRYEMIISNNQESGKGVMELLAKERTHWNRIAEKLHITVSALKGEKKVVQHGMTKDFKEHMTIFLDNLFGEGKDKTPPAEA